MNILKRFFSIAVLLIFWHLFSSELIPSPKESLLSIVELFKQKVLVIGILHSFYRYIIGLFIGVFLGICFGIILGIFPKLNAFFTPILDLLRPISPIAWTPAVVIIFGIGDKPTIFIIAYAVFFPVLLLSILSLAQVDKELINMAKGFGANKFQLAKGIFLPSCFLSLISALKLAASLAWINLVVGEMLGSQTGLGYLIIDARNQLELGSVFGLIFIIGFIGMLINMFFNQIEKFVKSRLGYD